MAVRLRRIPVKIDIKYESRSALFPAETKVLEILADITMNDDNELS